MRLSIERDAMRPLGSSSSRMSTTPASPTPMRSSVSALLDEPMSTHTSHMRDAFSRSSGLIR